MPRPILTLKQPAPEVGDVWKFVSAARDEFVQVVAIREDVVSIVALQPVTEGPPASRVDGPRWIDPGRFNGKKGGYRLHHRKGQQPT